MNKIKNLILSLVFLVTLFLMPSFVKTANAQEANQPGANKASNQQLRVELATVQDKLAFANDNLTRCDAAYNDLKASSEADQEAINKAATERKIYADLVVKYSSEVSTLKQALSDQKQATVIADKRAETATKEVSRQKRKVSFWKKLAKYGIPIGAAAGAASVLIIQK